MPALFAVFSDEQVMRYWSTLPMRDIAEARALLDDIRAGFQQRSLFQWGVARVGDDRVVGTCTLFNLDSRNRRAEIGYALARDCWGQGLMSEALGALIAYAFGPLDLLRLEADVDPRNGPSIRIVEKLGFVREGLLRERWHVGGEAQDSLILGLLRHEWEARAGRPDGA
ncbi:MAG: GNAT family N-acetyltransferase [Steroidobacteraceae bacterium]|nr:GNAT family N-acetyltransferase [Steroidobacteraceae bacterium]